MPLLIVDVPAAACRITSPVFGTARFLAGVSPVSSACQLQLLAAASLCRRPAKGAAARAPFPMRPRKNPHAVRAFVAAENLDSWLAPSSVDACPSCFGPGVLPFAD